MWGEDRHSLLNSPVTLNLFQGPSINSRSALASQWTLKQVQGDDSDQRLA